MLYRRDVWFSPEKVLLRYDEEFRKHGDAFPKVPRYKLMREAQAVGLFMLGMQKLQGREFWMQLVDPNEQSPDIRTATQLTETNNWLYTQDVEVVTLGSYVSESESVDEFLKRTKMNDLRPYPDDFTILCYIDRDIAVESWREVANRLKETGKKNDVFILGRADKEEPRYQLARIHPEIDHVMRFNTREDAIVSRTHTMRFERRLERIFKQTGEKYEPF